MFTKRFLIFCIALSIVFAGCGSAPEKETYTIGVIVELPWLAVIYDNFKESMTELGYVEGENVTYLYNPDAGPDQAAFDAEAARLMDQKVDLFFTIGTMTTRSAKTAVEGTDIPVVFTPVISPVAEGIVESLAHPSGNVTGVQIVDQSVKALEWALKIAPNAKHVYIPNNPADPITAFIIKSIYEEIPHLGIDLLPSEAASVDEMLAAVDSLPEDTIIFVVSPVSSLEPGVEQLGKLAQERGVPLFACNRGSDSPLISISDYTVSTADEARQGASMVDRILKGAKPADTPVETAEYFLNINLKHAQAVGLQVPEDVLSHANEIVR